MKILHYHFLRPPIPIGVIRSFRKQCASLSSVAHLPNTLLQTFILDRFRTLTIRGIAHCPYMDSVPIIIGYKFAL